MSAVESHTTVAESHTTVAESHTTVVKSTIGFAASDGTFVLGSSPAIANVLDETPINIVDADDNIITTFPFGYLIHYSELCQAMGLDKTTPLNIVGEYTASDFDHAQQYIRTHHYFLQLVTECNRQDKLETRTVIITPYMVWSCYCKLMDYYYKGYPAISFLQLEDRTQLFNQWYNKKYSDNLVETMEQMNTLFAAISLTYSTMTSILAYHNLDASGGMPYDMIEAWQCVAFVRDDKPMTYEMAWWNFHELVTTIDQYEIQRKPIDFPISYGTIVDLYTALTTIWNAHNKYYKQWDLEAADVLFIEKYKPSEYERVIDKIKRTQPQEVLSHTLCIPSVFDCYPDHVKEFESQSSMFDKNTRLSVKLMNKSFFESFVKKN